MFSRFENLLVVQILKKLYQIHDQLLFHELDPIKDVGRFGFTEKITAKKFKTKTKNGFINYEYLPLFSLVIYLFFDISYIFFKNSWKYSENEMPQLFTHLIFPAALYKEGDRIIFLAIGMSFVLFFVFAF